MFNVDRLELARKRRRWTARILSEKSGVSPVTLSRIVNRKQIPDTETVDRLISALGFPLEFFEKDSPDSIDVSAASFRSLAAMTARERDAALAAGMLAYEVADWLSTHYELPKADLIDLSFERDSSIAAGLLRQYWGIGERPIGNIIKLLESKGVRVFSLSEQTKNVDAFSVWRDHEPYVFLNTMKSTERSRFDAAHELGHLVLHRHGGPHQRSAEIEANDFAAAFLMPSADVLSNAPRVRVLEQIIEIKSRWGVSAAALCYRLNKMNVITEWQNRNFYIQLNQRYGTTEPFAMEPEKSAIWQMVLLDLWKQGSTRDRISDALYIPVEELDALIFGLAANAKALPKRSEGKPKLHAVR